jgi:hypothetical protein
MLEDIKLKLSILLKRSFDDAYLATLLLLFPFWSGRLTSI